MIFGTPAAVRMSPSGPLDIRTFFCTLLLGALYNPERSGLADSLKR
jgi:hypothetical protein